ncbi:MAG: hypothetical protein M3Q95_01795 [Bacteroidota bacterium]|nr:hypothetical protein [Bacteroidota bacterium]
MLEGWGWGKQGMSEFDLWSFGGHWVGEAGDEGEILVIQLSLGLGEAGDEGEKFVVVGFGEAGDGRI